MNRSVRQGFLAIKARSRRLLKLPFLARFRKRLLESPRTVAVKRTWRDLGGKVPCRRGRVRDAVPSRGGRGMEILPLLGTDIPDAGKEPPGKVRIWVFLESVSGGVEDFLLNLRANTFYGDWEIAILCPPRLRASLETVCRLSGVPRATLIDKGETAARPADFFTKRERPFTYAVFLDERVRVQPGWLCALVTLLEKSPETAVAVPRILRVEKTGGEDVGGGDRLFVASDGLVFRGGPGRIEMEPRVPCADPLHRGDGPAPIPAFSPLCSCWNAGILEEALRSGGTFPPDDWLDLAMACRERGRGIQVCPASVVLFRPGEEKDAAAGDPLAPAVPPKWVSPIGRDMWREKVEGRAPFWSARPLTIAMAVTENHPRSLYGDYFVASAMGKALSRFGYRVVFFPERPISHWDSISSLVDVLLVFRHDFDLDRVARLPNLIRIAWIRGYVEEWRSRPWFRDYDLVLATSEKALDRVMTGIDPGKRGGVLPLAADTDLFHPGPPDPQYLSDLSFVGNVFDGDRDFCRVLAVPPGTDFRFYGRLDLPSLWLRKYHRGVADHSEIPKIYNSSRVVLEDCTPMCRPWGCLNSRIFEAMACGACVLSNETPGLEELFGGGVTTYRDGSDFRRKLLDLLHDGEKRSAMGREARERIVAAHTYAHRAEEFRRILARFLGVQ